MASQAPVTASQMHLSGEDLSMTSGSMLRGELSGTGLSILPATLDASPADRTIAVSIGPRSRASSWITPALRTFNRLLNLPAGWDSYGANRIEIGSIEQALQILDRLMTENTPAPSIVPTADGGVQLEWHTHTVDLEIVVSPDRKPAFTFDDCISGQEHSGPVLDDWGLLKSLASRLSVSGPPAVRNGFRRPGGRSIDRGFVRFMASHPSVAFCP